jgi:uncharacterized membrane protein YebE (DUF533 family)
MFLTGFSKVATTMVTMSPEEYYDVVREKDPYVGENVGAISGAIAGATKGSKKKKLKSAVVGAGIGALAGAGAAHLGGKALRSYQAKKVRRMAEDLHLRATPGRGKK